GENLKIGRQKLCYVPGLALAEALIAPDLRLALASEAACFVQDLESGWPAQAEVLDEDAQTEPTPGGPDALRSLLDERLAAGRPTFLQAAPRSLPPRLEADLRDRLPVLDAT